jgi:hypothetical protein
LAQYGNIFCFTGDILSCLWKTGQYKYWWHISEVLWPKSYASHHTGKQQTCSAIKGSRVSPCTFHSRIRKWKDVQYSYHHTIVFTIRNFTVQATVTTGAITVFHITIVITDSSILTYQVHTVLTATPCNKKNNNNNKKTGWRIKLHVLF